MKYLLSLFAIAGLTQFALTQTGSLTTDVDFVNDVQCATYNLKLSNEDSTLHFKGVRARDTLNDIPTGMYRITFFSCDSSFHYGQKIEILEDEVRYIYFRNNGYVGKQYYGPYDYSDSYYSEYYDSLYPPVYFGMFYQFSRGFFTDGENPSLLNNYAFDITFGHDWLLTKPVALGYEVGYGFTRATYAPEDLADPSIIHEQQRFTTFDLNFALVSSIYVKEKRLLSIGGRYRLPYYARYARVNGNEKLLTRGLYRYNDFSVFAQLGYDWGYVFAEYRFDPIFREPLVQIPNLSLGVRLGFREEY